MGKKKVGRFIVDLDYKLGSGTYATVYKGIQSQTKQVVAVKVIDKQSIQSDQYSQKAFQQQIRIMMRLKSENIIQFLDVNQTKSNFYIVLEMANQGEFRTILNKKQKLSQHQTIGYVVQLLNAFGEMFKIGVIHRDIKPQNIFVKDGILKIGDFGFAKSNSQLDNMMSTIVGSPAYMAPQILNEQRYGYKCDIWSLGVMTYEMLTGMHPYPLKKQALKQIYKTIKNSALTFPQDIPISEHMKDFIRGCLKIKQQQRFDWGKVFLHPIFKGLFQKNFEGMKKGEENLGYIMGSFRMIIHQKNINIKNQIKKLQKDSLSFQEFKGFLQYLNCQIQAQQVQTLFDLLQKGNKVFLVDFQKLLQKYGCKVKELSISQQQSESQTGGKDSLARNLIRKTNMQKKIDFYDLLSESAKQTGKMTYEDFEQVIKKSVPQIPGNAISDLYISLFGITQKKQISIDKFIKIIYKVCEEVPVQKKN